MPPDLMVLFVFMTLSCMVDVQLISGRAIAGSPVMLQSPHTIPPALMVDCVFMFITSFRSPCERSPENRSLRP
jgi:hypothetical protein